MTYKGWYAIKPNKPNQTKPNNNNSQALKMTTLLRRAYTSQIINSEINFYWASETSEQSFENDNALKGIYLVDH